MNTKPSLCSIFDLAFLTIDRFSLACNVLRAHSIESISCRLCSQINCFLWTLSRALDSKIPVLVSSNNCLHISAKASILAAKIVYTFSNYFVPSDDALDLLITFLATSVRLECRFIIELQ